MPTEIPPLPPVFVTMAEAVEMTQRDEADLQALIDDHRVGTDDDGNIELTSLLLILPD